MIHIVCPPFVKGNNLRYLTDAIVDSLKKNKLSCKSYNYLNGDLPERETDGFYNMDKWMCIDANNVCNVLYSGLKDNDYVLFIDFWSPAVIHLKTHCILNNIRVKFVGWYHGSSTLDGDYLSKFNESAVEKFMKIELAMFHCFDKIWYASDYFRSGISSNVMSRTIKTGEPFNTRDYLMKRNINSNEKKWDVVIPFRLDRDKMDYNFVRELIVKNPELKFLIASPIRSALTLILNRYKNVEIKIGVSDEEHIDDLASSKVVFSCAYQEGWGYAVMKAITVGCIPVLPNRAVYPELYPMEYLYSTNGFANKLINLYVKNYPVKAFIPDDYYMDDAVEETFINMEEI